jgi:hypothetical protein
MTTELIEPSEELIKAWILEDEWELENETDDTGLTIMSGFNQTNLPPYGFKPDFVPVAQSTFSAEEIARLSEPATIICGLCGKPFETQGILRICTPCWNNLATFPKVHLRLEESDKYEQGVVVWDHNSIGGEPFDKEAVPVGVWGKYGTEGTKLTFWVSLCKPIEAVHDMMTQFQAQVRDNRALFNAQLKYSSRKIDETGTGYKPQYSKSRSKAPVVTPQPELSAAEKMRKFLGH